MTEPSQIKQFFTNQSILITGGTGFVGKVLIEKLLRECWDLKKIFLLIRPKKDKTPEERFDELFDLQCFERIRDKNLKEKVFLVKGDCNKPRLGLDPEDANLLKKETSCIFHVAANVRYDQSLKEAANHVKATREVVDLAKETPNLKVLVYVSTAYSNCVHPQIKEDFYKPPIGAETLIDLVDTLDERILEKITPILLGQWPSAYTYTKSVAEDVIARAELTVPMAVVRPAIIMNSISEPFPGWVDNIYGIIGLALGAAAGLVRTFHGKWHVKIPIVPVDHVSNTVLAAAWGTHKKQTKQVYNCIGFNTQLIESIEINRGYSAYYWDYPSMRAVWYRTIFEIQCDSDVWNRICVVLFHNIPAHIVDFVLWCGRKKPFAVKLYKKVNAVMHAMEYFRNQEWDFEQRNVRELWGNMGEEDQEVFNFSMENINWKSYFKGCTWGMRKFLMKEDEETIPRAKKRLRKLQIVHYSAVVLLWFLIYKLVMFACDLFKILL